MVLIDQNGETFTGFLFSKKKQVGEIKSEDTFKDNKAGKKDEFGDTFPVDESKKNMFDAKKITEAADAAATAKDAAATAAEASELARELPKGYGDSIYLRREITAEATAAAAEAAAAATLAPLVKEDGTFNPTTFNPDSSAEPEASQPSGGIPKKDYLKTTKALAGWYEQAIWAMLDKNLKEIRKNNKLPACKVTKIVVRQVRGPLVPVVLDTPPRPACPPAQLIHAIRVYPRALLPPRLAGSATCSWRAVRGEPQGVLPGSRP